MKSRKLRGGILGTTTQGLIKKLNKFYRDLDDKIIGICIQENDHACLLRVQPKTPLQQKLRDIMDKFKIAEGMEKSIFSNVGHFFTKSKNYFSKSNSLNVSSIEKICDAYLDALRDLMELLDYDQNNELFYLLSENANTNDKRYKIIDHLFNDKLQKKLLQQISDNIKINLQNTSDLDNRLFDTPIYKDDNRSTFDNYDDEELRDSNFLLNPKFEGGTSNSRRKRKPKTKRKLKTRRRR